MFAWQPLINPLVNEASFKDMPLVKWQEAAGDRWSHMSIDRPQSRMCCVHNLLTIQRTATGQVWWRCVVLAREKQPPCGITSIPPPYPKKWLSSSCCHGLPGKTPIASQQVYASDPQPSPLPILLHPLKQQTVTPPSNAAPPSLSQEALMQACVEPRMHHAERRGKDKWEVLIPSELGCGQPHENKAAARLLAPVSVH